MNAKDRKLLEISCKKTLIKIIKENKKIKKLDFFERIEMYNSVKEMSYNEALSMLINNGKPLTLEQTREFESGVGKAAKYGGSAIIGGAIAGPIGSAAGLAGMYIYRKFSNTCVRQHLGDKPAQLKCRMEAIKKAMYQIKVDMRQCYLTKNPDKCVKKLNNSLAKWQVKFQQLLIQYNKSKKLNQEI